MVLDCVTVLTVFSSDLGDLLILELGFFSSCSVILDLFWFHDCLSIILV